MSNKSSRSQSQTPNQKADDFRLINGLPKTAKAKLHAAGILTFDQLAMMSPHEIVAAIEDSNSANAETSAERIIRDDWIGQAQKLAESLKVAVETSSDPLPAATNKSEERITSFVLELKLSRNNTVKQTRVMHVESAEKDAEKKWEGWNEVELVSFIAHRAGVVLPAALREAEVAEQTPIAVTSIEERLRRLHAKSEPAAATAAFPELPQPASSLVESAHRPAKSEMKVFVKGMGLPSGLVSSGEPYSLKVLLDPSLITSPDTSELAYTVTIYAKPLADAHDSAGKHHSSIIGETQGTIKQPTDHLVFDIQGADLARGAYRLQATASFQSQTPKKAARKHFTTFVEGGLLQVF